MENITSAPPAEKGVSDRDAQVLDRGPSKPLEPVT